MAEVEHDKNTLYCSFCGKSQHEVRKLIAGPIVFICNECVLLCFDIIAETPDAVLPEKADAVARARKREEAAAHIARIAGRILASDLGKWLKVYAETAEKSEEKPASPTISTFPPNVEPMVDPFGPNSLVIAKDPDV